MSIPETVAKNVKEARIRKELTLDEAAAATGVSRSMLSQIEKGSVNPTISVLWKIANGYRISFSRLVQEKEEAVSVVRKESITPLTEDEGRYINHPVFPFKPERKFEIYRIEILPEGHLKGEPHLPGTEEFITVFAGNAEITTGEGTFLLTPGDAIRFRADVEHAYRNTGKDTVQLSMVIFYPDN